VIINHSANSFLISTLPRFSYGANWAGPIQHFTLHLKYNPNGVVLFNHFYGNAKATIKQTAGNTQISLTNFIPKQDLDVLFENDPETPNDEPEKSSLI